jgi:preprotein translocase subunit SecE
VGRIVREAKVKFEKTVYPKKKKKKKKMMMIILMTMYLE